MKRRMIERTNERTNDQTNEWMNEWMNGYKKKGIHWWTEEWIEEIKIQRVKYIAFLVLSYRSKTSLSRGGFGGFWMRHSKFTWSSTRLCNIFMTSPRWQFISCQYSTFLPLYSTEDKWYALLSPGISCSPPPPPPPPPDSPPPLLSRQMMSGLQEKNVIRHDTLKIHYLDTHCMWKHTPGN